MADYISREAILNVFQVWREELTLQIADNIDFPHTRSDLKVCRTQLDDCISAIKEMHAADVRPVVSGEWWPAKDGYYGHVMCSVCHKIESHETGFCPNCGCQMNGGRK